MNNWPNTQIVHMQKAFSFRGLGPLTLTRGSAPGPHWALFPHHVARKLAVDLRVAGS